MEDQAEDIGNEQILEGGEEIFAGIDEVMNQTSTEPDKTQTTTQTEAQTEAGTETPEAKAEIDRVQRARDEEGRFAKEEKEKADKLAAEQKAGAPESKDYPAEIKSPKAREHFDTIKKQRDEERRRADGATIKLKALESKVQELESKSGTAAPEVKVLQSQLAELQAKLDEREKIISFKAVEETTPFREGVTEPMTEAEKDMEEISAQYGLEISSINKVLSEPNKFKRNEMLADMTENLPERSRIGVHTALKEAADKWIKADQTRAKLYENAKGSREFAEQERMQAEAKAALERQQAYQNANKEVDTIMREKYPELAGDEEAWKGITEKAFKVADFDRMPPRAKAFANLTSWAFLKAMEKLREETKAHNATKEIMAKRNGAVPNAGGGKAAVTRTDENDETDIFGALDKAFQDA